MTVAARARTLTIAAAALTALLATPARADAQRAVSDFKAGRYLDAATEIQAVVDRDPGYAYGHFILGHCLLKMRRPAEAEGAFRRALAIDGGHPEFHLGLSLALKAQANFRPAIQAASIGIALAHDPKDLLPLLVVRGFLWSAVGHWGDAARDLEAARQIRSDPAICLLLARAYVNIGAFAAAIPRLKDAEAGSPDDPTVQRLLAVSYLGAAAAEPDPARKKALYGEALSPARRLAGAQPDDPDAVHLDARATLGVGEAQLAVGLFLRVLSLDPRRCTAMVNLGRAYMSLGRWNEADAALRQAAACAPRMAVVYETMGDLYLRQGMTEQAANAFRRADEIEPRDGSPGRAGSADMIPVRAPR